MKLLCHEEREGMALSNLGGVLLVAVEDALDLVERTVGVGGQFLEEHRGPGVAGAGEGVGRGLAPDGAETDAFGSVLSRRNAKVVWLGFSPPWHPTTKSSMSSFLPRLTPSKGSTRAPFEGALAFARVWGMGIETVPPFDSGSQNHLSPPRGMNVASDNKSRFH